VFINGKINFKYFSIFQHESWRRRSRQERGRKQDFFSEKDGNSMVIIFG